MKEILIHQDSRLLYTQREEQFVYVCEHHEIVLFGCAGIRFQQHTAACEEKDCLLLRKHQIYTFQLPANGILLITCLPFTSQESLSSSYTSAFQHEEIQNLCILLGDLQGLHDELHQLLHNAYQQRLGFLVLNSYTYIEDMQQTEKPAANEERLKKIHTILVEHLHEELTLAELAEQLHLTPQYVSQFFKNSFGMTFLRYMNTLRLHAAMADIQQGNASFLTIAMRYGFANVRSFQAAFMKCFHSTPKQYRQLLQQKSIPHQGAKEDEAYQQFMSRMRDAIPASYRDEMEQHYRLTLHAKGEEKLTHAWEELMTVGRARLLLTDDIRRQLTQIQQDIGFHMIRFHGIFNDDMHVYEEDEQGLPFYNFHQVNEALDFVLKLGLKPFIELGFMPSMLAKYPDMAILNRMFLVSPPKDMLKWQGLVQAFLKSCINRYGLDEVLNWYFEFWNNAGLDNQDGDDEVIRKKKFWQDSPLAYLEFYKATYQAVKAIHPQLRIGGPSVDVSMVMCDPHLLDAYFHYLMKHQCMIDFITFHVYPIYLQLKDPQEIDVTKSFQDSMPAIRGYAKKHHLKQEIHITEWSTWGYPAKKGFNDGCGKAVYILKSIVDTLGEYQSLGYWTFSDYTETMKTRQSDIYSDNVGLFTSNGICKAAYHAYTLLHKLGDVLLRKGDNYLLTRKHKNYQLLLFHCASSQENHAMVDCFQITIQGMANGTYEKKVYSLNERSGSSYDVWKRMGSHQEIMEEDVQYLKAHAMMSYVRETIHIEQHEDHETRRLKNEEAMLIEWIYKY